MNKLSKPLIKQIIITRPAGQAVELIAKLGEVVGENIQLIHHPLIKIQPLKFMAPDLNEYNGAIFISGNAAKHFLTEYQLPKIRLLAVGENTAAKVTALTRQEVSFPAQMNAEGLLDLEDLQELSGQKWLIIKGEGGRTLIYQGLVKRGAIVSEVDVYRRALPDFESQQKIYQSHLTDPLWLITSAEALSHLFRILGLAEKRGHNTRVIVSSERLVSLALQKGFNIVAQSSGASETQLVECINKLVHDQVEQIKQ